MPLTRIFSVVYDCFMDFFLVQTVGGGTCMGLAPLLVPL
jgi:hypothetical protein